MCVFSRLNNSARRPENGTYRPKLQEGLESLLAEDTFVVHLQMATGSLRDQLQGIADFIDLALAGGFSVPRQDGFLIFLLLNQMKTQDLIPHPQFQK